MLRRLILALLAPGLLLALPLILRPGNPSEDKPAQKSAWKLVIVTPHTEQIRYEFEQAFRKHCLEKFGRDVEFDFRNVGGTSDIVRYVGDRFEAVFRREYESGGGVWTPETARNFKNPKADPAKVPERAKFLASENGIGIDLFFGGGTFDHARFANIGYAVGAGAEKRHPDWFRPDVIPQSFAGEEIYDPRGRYYGVCLSSFGIAYNPDRFNDESMTPPRAWADLGNPALFQKIELADPTKSGSITKCYEMILQQAMAKTSPAEGWNHGFALMKRIAGNARCVTDSAGKLVRDVSSGAAAAGMCIDFYGFSEAEITRKNSGRDQLIYRMPENGSAVTADPVQLLRGAPNPEPAREFIDFLLSPEGQALWMRKPGTPGGPERHALLRPCVRRDLYGVIPDSESAIPGYDPYALSGTFQYRGAWTGRYFSLIRVLIKCAVLDPADELRETWKLIIEHGGPEKNPEAAKLFYAMPFGYEQASAAAEALSGDPARAAKVRREWTEFTVRNCREARRRILEGKK